jgi:dihydroorotate dehydrogenase electron transfer subunit
MHNNISKFDLRAKILSNKKVAESHFRMELACPEIASIARPGQFIHLLINQRRDPLLRRPFTIFRAKNGSIEILFQVIGRGTRLLSQKRPGDEVRIMGPLGNSFFILNELETAILVGGGIGIASLMMLAEELKQRGKRSIGLIGAQNCRRILCVDEFQAVGAEVYVSTDDGSCGYHGLVTELLRKILSNPQKYRLHATRNTQHATRNTHHSSLITHHASCIYACGPDGMLKSVAKIAAEFHIPAQLALENRMACGVGACLGCVLKIKSANGGFEYRRVCTEGPVFDAQEIVWD